MPLPIAAAVGLGMRHVIALLLGLLVAASSFAQSSQLEWFVTGTQGNGPWTASTADGACQAAGPSYSGAGPYTYRAGPISGTVPNQSAQCQFAGTGSYVYLGATAVMRCSNGGTWNSAAQACQGANPCLEKQGQSKDMRFEVGYARSNDPNADDYVPPFTNPSNSTFCDGTCQITTGGSNTWESAWRSQVPAANGLHRISVQMPVTYNGQQCSQVSGPLDPTRAPPPCPGTLGEVNGRPVCFGTPSNPLPTTPRPGGPPEGYGNPAGGDAPSSGPGSGSGPNATPVSGNGGPAGGGSNAAIPGGGSEGNGQGTGTPRPTNPDGTSSGGGSGSNSGEPTPIDEAGMPSGAGAYDGATAGVNANRDAAVAGVNSAAGTAGKNTSWSFVFAFPTGCSEIPLGAFAPYLSGVNVCAYQDTIHDLMSLIWLAVTVFCCIGMVGRAVGGGTS